MIDIIKSQLHVFLVYNTVWVDLLNNIYLLS